MISNTLLKKILEILYMIAGQISNDSKIMNKVKELENFIKESNEDITLF